MAAKKKTKKKPAKKATRNRSTSPKKAAKKKSAAKRKTSARAPKKSAMKKAAVKASSSRKKASAKKVGARKKPAQSASEATFPPTRTRERSSGQSGDLQGLSNRQRADSESVDELVEEGNAFEANAVSGVEAADDADEQEVHTHEVPEDDVPEEYLDQD
jgi:hypothetical protein